MATHKKLPGREGQVSRRDLPPPAESRAVKLGIASVTKTGRVEYQWHLVYDLWLVRPESSVAAFARWAEIPYETLKCRSEFDAEAKARLLAEATTTWRDEMAKTLVARSFGDAESVGASFAETVNDMRQMTSLATSYARGRMVKIDSAGRLVANATLEPEEVHRLMRIVASAAVTLRALVDIGRAVADAAGGDQSPPVVRKRVASLSSPSDPEVDSLAAGG